MAIARPWRNRLINAGVAAGVSAAAAEAGAMNMLSGEWANRLGTPVIFFGVTFTSVLLSELITANV